MDAKTQLGLLLAAFKEADTPALKATLASAMRELAECEYCRLQNG